MRDGWIIVLIIIASVSIGGILYIFGGSAFQSSSPAAEKPRDGITILAQGANATNVTQRVNYRITNVDELEALWELIYGSNPPSMPVVDFAHKEVLAVFDGSHSTGGYGVMVEAMKDEDGKRIIHITHTEPGTSCNPMSGGSSPFIVVETEKTTLPLAREESTEPKSCR